MTLSFKILVAIVIVLGAYVLAKLFIPTPRLFVSLMPASIGLIVTSVVTTVVIVRAFKNKT